MGCSSRWSNQKLKQCDRSGANSTALPAGTEAAAGAAVWDGGGASPDRVCGTLGVMGGVDCVVVVVLDSAPHAAAADAARLASISGSSSLPTAAMVACA